MTAKTTIACLIFSIALSSCNFTSRMWKDDGYNERIYGIEIGEIEGEEVVVIQGRRNQYITTYTDNWKRLAESKDEDRVTITSASALRSGDVIQYDFEYSVPDSDHNGEIIGQAKVLPLETLPIIHSGHDEGVQVYIAIQDGAIKTGGKILATPVTLALDATGKSAATVAKYTAFIFIVFAIPRW